jgi:hypothetical protein
MFAPVWEQGKSYCVRNYILHMSNNIAETPHLDRSANGQFLPGNTISNKASKEIAHKMAELKRAYMEAVQPEDAALVYSEHMKCIKQDKDYKLKLAGISLWYDRNYGRAVESLVITGDGLKQPPINYNLNAEQISILNNAAKIIRGTEESQSDVIEVKAEVKELPPSS